MKKAVALQWLLETLELKKNDGLALCTKDGLLVVRYFPSANTNGMGLYIKPVRNMSFYNKKYVGSV